MIRLLLVDDDRLVRQGLKVLLQVHDDLQVVGEAENSQEAIEQIEELSPDLILMDIRMPEIDGVATTQIIRQRFSNVKVLMLSTFDDDDYINRSMVLGAMGYLLKDTDSEELAQAIRLAHKGYTQLGPGLFQKLRVDDFKTVSTATRYDQVTQLPVELEQLTKREKEVLCKIIAGATNREIAQALFISERTVKNHVTSILSQLKVRDRVQASMFASPYLPSLNILNKEE